MNQWSDMTVSPQKIQVWTKVAKCKRFSTQVKGLDFSSQTTYMYKCAVS